MQHVLGCRAGLVTALLMGGPWTAGVNRAVLSGATGIARRFLVVLLAGSALTLFSATSLAQEAADSPPDPAATEAPSSSSESTPAAEPEPPSAVDATASSEPGEPAESTQALPPQPGEPATAQATPRDAAVSTIPVQPIKRADDEASSPKSDGPVALDEIFVTATKREESPRSIPGTVNVITGEELEAIGARELTDFLKLVPGITLQENETGNGRTISIRGIGPQPGANTTTGVLIENVAMNDPYQSYLVPDLDPFDLHDLEVLKGPQGTLFGASALNGAIRYVMNKPRLGEWEVKGFGNWQTISQGGEGLAWGAAINMPVSEHTALRVAGVRQELPGLYDDVNANGKNQPDADEGGKTMYRVMGLWTPNDELSVNAFFLKQDNHRDNLSVANNHDGEFERSNTPGPSISHQVFEVANLEVSYEFDWFTLVSETSRSAKLQDINYDGSAVLELAAQAGVETLRLHALADTEAVAQEFRLVSPISDSPWTWIGGIYLYNYKAIAGLNAPIANTELNPGTDRRTVLRSLSGIPLNLTPTSDGLSAQYVRLDPVKAKEQSLFGELARKFFDDRLEVGLGARLYQEKLDANLTVEGGTGPYSDVIGYSDDQHMEAKGFNPKATAKFQWKPNFLLYAAAARGFQFGGLNNLAPVPSDNVYPLTYKPSSVWSYEAGARSDWIEKTLQLDITAFYIDWTDMQLRQDVPSGNTDYIGNVSRARSVGLESAVRWRTPLPGLLLINTASLTRATVEEPYTAADGNEIQKGTDLPAAPHFQSATSLSYAMPFGAYTAGASLTYAYIGEAFNNINHDTIIFDYGTIDASINFGAPQWDFAPEVTVTGNNLTDERALVGARFTRVGPQELGSLGVYNRPRSFLARLTFHF